MRKRKETKAKYESKFYKIVPTIIFGLAGLFYVAAPHDIHVASGLGLGETHETHIIYGIAFLIIAGVFWWFSYRKRPILS